VGTYSDATGRHGFLYVDTNISTIDVPNAHSTNAVDINNAGDIVARYEDTGIKLHGFLYTEGNFITIDFPGANRTTVTGINNTNDIVGTYGNATGTHGFLYADGNFTTIDFPGADSTAPHGINDYQDIVGTYIDATGRHGFLYTEGGFVTIDFPGTTYTITYDINNANEIVGHIEGPPGVHSFLYYDGSFTMIDVPDGWGTQAFGINNYSDIVGDFRNPEGVHGFLATALRVTVVELDIKPGSCPNPLNTKSKGVLPVAILGTEDFDVTQIDVSTVLLAGVAPIRDNLEDVAAPFNGLLIGDCFDCTEEGADGLTDLTLKFDTQEVVAALGDANDGGCIQLTITGELTDGTPIEGTDSVVIVPKPKEPKPIKYELIIGSYEDDEEEDTYWVDIELLGENGEPVPGQEYWVYSPDGATVGSGTTDENGRASLSVVGSGTYLFTVPDLDEEAWERVK
jgi:hypothetical protein